MRGICAKVFRQQKIVYEKSKAYIMFYMSYNSCMMFRQYGTENSKNRPIEADPDTLYGKS